MSIIGSKTCVCGAAISRLTRKCPTPIAVFHYDARKSGICLGCCKSSIAVILKSLRQGFGNSYAFLTVCFLVFLSGSRYSRKTDHAWSNKLVDSLHSSTTMLQRLSLHTLFDFQHLVRQHCWWLCGMWIWHGGWWSLQWTLCKSRLMRVQTSLRVF